MHAISSSTNVSSSQSSSNGPLSAGGLKTPATMVVIEFSATWPRWLKPGAGDMALVAQHYEGAPASLVTQVASRTARLEAVGWQMGTLVLVSNGRTDPEAVAARSVLARSLLARMRQRGGGSMVLALDERLGKRAAAQLRELAAALHRTSAAAGVTLAVRVGDLIWGVAPEALSYLTTPSVRAEPAEPAALSG